jgi:hypothetical protein
MQASSPVPLHQSHPQNVRLRIVNGTPGILLVQDGRDVNLGEERHPGAMGTLGAVSRCSSTPIRRGQQSGAILRDRDARRD